MKRNIPCYLACFCLIIALVLPIPVAMADMRNLDTALLPEDTIAVAISPADNSRIIYAIYGLTKDEETLSVSVRQISTDPELTIYQEDVTNVSELDIRQLNEFTKDQPIIGSYCEAYIEKDPDGEKDSDRWSYPTTGEIIPHGSYMDETFCFSLSDLGNIDEKIILRMGYNCIPVPGTLDGHPLCILTIDLSDYLNQGCPL